ncbi:ComEA family DNA-binding protein [Carnimonas nigrificans]|uniref:ComEA family DNA-binding protein n=1 Tax=Carnimonas nigrificans TaxID=64323 RepID=UPI00046FAE15|nr:helix-hairpin-helix domain-containing protein [Carnimonas nigrificans]
MKTWLTTAIYSLLLASTLAFASPPPININTASVAELVALPGIGKAKAEAIVAERDANGPFVDAEDLSRVSGIGTATAKKLEQHLEFSTPQGDSAKPAPNDAPRM